MYFGEDDNDKPAFPAPVFAADDAGTFAGLTVAALLAMTADEFETFAMLVRLGRAMRNADSGAYAHRLRELLIRMESALATPLTRDTGASRP